MSDPTWYPVRLGPLRFAAQVGPETETLGDKLEAVGSALVPGERAAKPLPLVLAIRGSLREVDDRAVGFRLRRQVRALLGNDAWKSSLYFEMGADPESRCWLSLGSGDLTGNGRGVTFGDWRLSAEAYVVGRPAEVRRGRRIVMVDRTAPGIASDTRRMLYTADLKGTVPLPSAWIPGPVTNVLGHAGREVPIGPGPVVGGRMLWQTVTVVDGEGVAWTPSVAALPSPIEREARAEEPGEVRAWTLPGTYAASGNTSSGDFDPTEYGWERLFGGLHDQSATVAVDNGWTRIVWGGPSTSGGLHLERWDTSTSRYVPMLRLMHYNATTEARIVQLTPERAVVSWLSGAAEMRAILQRGWPGPRVESYAAPAAGAVARLAVSAGTRRSLGYVDEIALPGDVVAFAARSHDAVTWSAAPYVVGGWAGEWSAPRVLVQQFDLHVGSQPLPERVRTLARWDVQLQPTLMTR